MSPARSAPFILLPGAVIVKYNGAKPKYPPLPVPSPRPISPRRHHHHSLWTDRYAGHQKRAGLSDFPRQAISKERRICEPTFTPTNPATSTFTNGPGASRYFILASVAVTGHAAETALLELRRELAWAGEPLPAGFHATNDKQRVRDRVFAIIARHNFRVDATILEKRKANPSRRTPSRLYGLAWHYHLSGVLSALANPDEIHIVRGRHQCIRPALRISRHG